MKITLENLTDLDNRLTKHVLDLPARCVKKKEEEEDGSLKGRRYTYQALRRRLEALAKATIQTRMRGRIMMDILRPSSRHLCILPKP